MSDIPPLRPILIERAEDDGSETPATVPPVPDLDAVVVRTRIATPRRSALSRFAVWVFGTLFSFVLSVAAWDFVTTLLARDSLLGWIAMILVGLAIVTALALALREMAGFARMARIDTLRTGALEAALKADVKAARHVVSGLGTLYAARPELAEAQVRLTARGAEMFDADGLLGLAEQELLGPLDQAARREVEAAARQVATVTALVPLALADVVTALYANLRMIRRIAAIYGGRSGTLGSLRLMRGVFTHLAATGALAVGDDMIHSVAGGSVLSRISRRFGEGVVNGALTARVGVAAIDVCRPLPFRTLPRPKTSNLVSRGLAGLFADADQGAKGQ